MNCQILDVFRRRFACHRFLENRTIPDDDLALILEAGRLSPSSFGLEPWKFVVVASADKKQALQTACFDQPQVGNASVVMVLLAKTAELAPGTDYVNHLLEREYPGDALPGAQANYRGFHANTNVPAWSISQCHIAAANMMTAAAAIGIDTCAIGGFLPDAVRKILDIDGSRYEVALILPIGYCADPAPEKQRLPMSELVEYC